MNPQCPLLVTIIHNSEYQRASNDRPARQGGGDWHEAGYPSGQEARICIRLGRPWSPVFVFWVFLRPGISDIARNKGVQRGLSGLYRCCKVSTATKCSFLPSGPAFSPFLPWGLWDKDPAGQVPPLWSRDPHQEQSLPLVPEIRHREGGSLSPAPGILACRLHTIPKARSQSRTLWALKVPKTDAGRERRPTARPSVLVEARRLSAET